MDSAIYDTLAMTPKNAAYLVAESPDAELDVPGPGGMSVRDILTLCRDAEALVFRVRLERMLAEDKPALASFGPIARDEARTNTRNRKEELLADFALQRQASIGLLRGLTPAQWDRAGTLEGEPGPLTITTLVQRWLEHDALQLGRLESALGATLDDIRIRRTHDYTH